MADDYAERGVEVWCISPNDPERYPGDSPEAMRERVEREGLADAVPVRRDAGGGPRLRRPDDAPRLRAGRRSPRPLRGRAGRRPRRPVAETQPGCARHWMPCSLDPSPTRRRPTRSAARSSGARSATHPHNVTASLPKTFRIATPAQPAPGHDAGMTRREIAPQPLLCELHSHTTWSDGKLRIDELVDLYGTSGFDVLCVTDHVLRSSDPTGPMIDAATYDDYLESIGQEAERALREYDLLRDSRGRADRLRPRSRQGGARAGRRPEPAGDARARAPGRTARGTGRRRGDDRRPPAFHRAGLDPRPDDPPLLARARPDATADRPLRADQPRRRVLVGGGREPARRGVGRLPHARPPGDLEDRVALREERPRRWSRTCAPTAHASSPASRCRRPKPPRRPYGAGASLVDASLVGVESVCVSVTVSVCVSVAVSVTVSLTVSVIVTGCGT